MKILKNWYFTVVGAFLNNARSLMGSGTGGAINQPALDLVMDTLAPAVFLRIIGEV